MAPLTNREKQIRKRAKKRAEMGEDAHKAEESQRRRNDRGIGKAVTTDPTLAVVQMVLKTKVTASKQAHKARANESEGLLLAVEQSHQARANESEGLLVAVKQNHAARATENTQLDGVLANILKKTASQNARQPVAFEPVASEEDEVDDEPEPELEPDVLDEDDYVDDILEPEPEHDNRQPNAHWKPKRRNRIVLPLTDEHRVIPFNMEEDMCLTTMEARLLQEAFEDFLPGVQPKPGLGSDIAQVYHDLPFPVRKDMLWYIRQGRVTIQHEKKRVYALEMPDNPAEYEAAMVRVLGALCPNWKLEHYNREAGRLRAVISHKDAVIADKDNYIANLERQLKDKRRREDEEEGHGGYGGAKRARRGYDVRDRNYETYDY
jgi:hypothetical protein